jgi:hypothetical protein
MAMALVALAGAACLVTLVVAGSRARAEQTRPPTAAERAAAASAAVAGRWRTWRAGRIFPATLGYVTDLRTHEMAQRVGISPADGCAAALAGVLAAVAQRDGCRAGLRATYLDGLQGVVYTAGVFAFGSAGRAAAFVGAVTSSALPDGLRAFGPTGTSAARFDDAARQSAAAESAGPYVVLTVAGYADGRPASASGERRLSIFAPASQLAGELLAPLSRPVTVNCASREWAC